ncbi:hypothetical protein [Nonomuraea rubra]|uniref:hypothetical protein n=1 Tax=Nonomuraea rubra TaxID=46180 RepID=UPI003620CA3B
MSQVGEEDVRACPVTPAAHDELVAMARESQGEAAAGSVRFWLERRPEAFTLLRSRGAAGQGLHELAGAAPPERGSWTPIRSSGRSGGT